jgi:hypothetical protein
VLDHNAECSDTAKTIWASNISTAKIREQAFASVGMSSITKR